MNEIGADNGLGEATGTVKVFVCSVSSDLVNVVEPSDCMLLEEFDVEERTAEETGPDEGDGSVVGEVGVNESVIEGIEVGERVDEGKVDESRVDESGADEDRVDDVTELFHL